MLFGTMGKRVIRNYIHSIIFLMLTSHQVSFKNMEQDSGNPNVMEWSPCYPTDTLLTAWSDLETDEATTLVR